MPSHTLSDCVDDHLDKLREVLEQLRELEQTVAAMLANETESA